MIPDPRAEGRSNRRRSPRSRDTRRTAPRISPLHLCGLPLRAGSFTRPRPEGLCAAVISARIEIRCRATSAVISFCVFRKRTPIFTTDKTFVDAFSQRNHSFGALTELWKQRCDSGHGSGIRSCAVVYMATVASQASSHVEPCLVRRVVENALPERSQVFSRSPG